MKTNKTPYLSLKGMPFKASSSEFEINLNIRKALSVIRSFAMDGCNASEAIMAIEYIEQECPKVQIITEDMRLNFFDDELFPNVDAGRLRRMKLQLCSDLEKRTLQGKLISHMEVFDD